MRTLLSLLSNFSQAASPLRMLLVDALHVLRLCLRSPTALAAENLFLRTQLALYQERQGFPGRAGGSPPGPPTDPYVSNELIRFFGHQSLGTTLAHHDATPPDLVRERERLWVWAGRTSSAAAGIAPS